jgi:hypothetical protein
MKLLNLAYEGVGGKKGVLSFDNKINGLTAVADGDGDFFKKLVAAAFYGAEGYDNYEFPARLEIRFSHEDKEYSLKRLYDKAEDIISELAVLTDVSESSLFAETPENVRKFIEADLSIPKNIFDRTFVIDKSAAASLSAAKAEREAFAGKCFEGLPSPAEVGFGINAFKEKEKSFLKEIEDIPAVTKKSIRESKQASDSLKEELAGVRKEEDGVLSAVQKARACEESSEKLMDAAEQGKKLEGEKEAVSALADALRKSREATELKKIFFDYEDAKAELQKNKETLAAKEKEYEEVSKKLSESEESRKSLEKDFTAASEKRDELDKQVRSLIKESSASPDKFKINQYLEKVYKAHDEAASAIRIRKDELDSEIEALRESVKELEEKKKSLFTTASYRKDVAEAALLEESLKRLEDEYKYSDVKLEALEKEREELSGKHDFLSSKVFLLRDAREALYKKIAAGYPGIREAVNADVIYKQTIYAKHLTVGAAEVELDAVDKKIAAVADAAEQYLKKYTDAAARKREVESHVNKLTEKLALLEDKKNDFESFNKMKEISDRLDYGDRCPVCDSVVTIKKDMPQKDIKPLLKQIDLIEEELKKSEAALFEATSAIGQYEAAERVGKEYLAALKKTRDIKQAIIDEILADYGAKDIKSLFDMVGAAAERSRALTLSIDKYSEQGIELSGASEADEVVAKSLKKVSEEEIPAEKARLKALTEESKGIAARLTELQPKLNGSAAGELLLKVQVAEKEYETTVRELEEKEDKLAELTAASDELTKALMSAYSRAFDIDEDGVKTDYKNIVIKGVMSDLSAIIRMIDVLEEDKEVAKTRLAALLKIISKSKSEAETLSKEIAALKAKTESADSFIRDVFASYDDRFSALGITKEDDFIALILDEPKAAEYQKKLVEYDEEAVINRDTVSRLTAEINLNRPFYEEKENNIKKLAELKDKEEKTLLALSLANADLNEKIARQDKINALNRELSFLQSRIKEMEEAYQSFCPGGGFNFEEFVKTAVERASSKVKNWSKDRYSLVLAESVDLVNEKKGKAVKADKYTGEEKALKNIGLAAAFSDLIRKLYGADFEQCLPVSAEECERGSLSVIAEAGKDSDLLVCPEDEGLFFKALSKLAI